MSLLEEMKKVQADQKPVRCAVGRALRDLGKDSEGLQKALDDPAINGTTIAKVMTAKGHKMHDNMVSRHRRAICSCFSET